MAQLLILLAKLSPVWQALGSALLGILAQLFAGKAFKKLLLWPFEVLVKKTKNTKDDELITQAEKDLGLEGEENGKQ